MTAPINRPDEWRTLGDHERRVRDLEAICCGSSGTGFEDAVAIRDRSCSWYGLGQNCSDDCDFTNFQEGGPGHFFQGDDCDVATAAAVGGGEPATYPGGATEWPLSEDSASYIGCPKRYCEPGGYPFTPSCAIDDGLDGTANWSFNLWLKWIDWPTICSVSTTHSYGSGGIFGYRAAGDGGLYLSTAGGVVTDPTPAPIPVLSLNFFDGVGMNAILFGDPSDTQDWRMITVTWDAATMTLSGYMNGAFIDSVVCTTDQTILAGDITVGTLNFGGFFTTNYGGWDGYIDEVGIWCDEALSAADVAVLYLAGTPPAPIVAADMDSGDALCGEPLVADGEGGATWGNSCALDSPFALPAVGVVTVQDVVDALVAMGLVTQGT